MHEETSTISVSECRFDRPRRTPLSTGEQDMPPSQRYTGGWGNLGISL
jgi:hypothetical protein